MEPHYGLEATSQRELTSIVSRCPRISSLIGLGFRVIHWTSAPAVSRWGRRTPNYSPWTLDTGSLLAAGGTIGPSDRCCYASVPGTRLAIR